MSWEGHLAGLITGFLFSILFRKSIVKPETYVWQQPDYDEDNDPFLKHFDEHGNFIESEKVEEKKTSSGINFTYKENKDN